MTPRKSLDSTGPKRPLPKQTEVENYNDEINPALVETLRERYAERLRKAKPKSEASW